MPKIAQYQPNQVRSQISQQPRAKGAPAGAFNTAIGAGLGNIVQAGLDIKNRIDTTSAEEALVQFERDKNQLFFDPENGYFNTQGRNAYDNSSAAVEGMEDLKRKYGETLNEQSRAMFDKIADGHITRGQTDITRHASKGLKVWEVATIESQVENSIENASLYWNDSKRLKVQNVLGRQAVIDSAEMMGIGAEATNEKLQTYDSSFAQSAIEAAITNSSASGKQALDDYGDKLEGPYKVKMQGMLDKKMKAEKTQAEAGLAVMTATNLNAKYDTRSDIMSEVDKIKDPVMRKKVMSESMSIFSRKKQAEKEEANNNYNDAIGMVNQGMSYTEIEAKNPEAWLGMTDLQRNNIQSGKHMITDQVLYNKTMALPSKEKAELDVNDLSGKINPTDLRKIAKEVEKAKKFKPSARIESFSKKVNKAAKNAFPGKWDTKGSGRTNRGKKADDFMKVVRDAITEFQENNGRDATPEEEDKIIGEFTREIVVERSRLGFDILASDTELDVSNTPAKDIRILNRIMDSSETIDQVDLIDAYQFLIDNNQTVTIDSLREVYKQGRQ